MAKMPALVTLTTDFGLSDEYVGTMKGVLISRAPEIRIVDLTHAIPPFDVVAAAYMLAASYRYFPKGSIHVVVVDPGVGGPRDVVLLLVDGHLFLAPDNGLLTLLLKKKDLKAFKITNNELFLPEASQTFHGRDIFAPLAAHLSKGAEPDTVGEPISVSALQKINLPEARIDCQEGRIRGSIISIDHFGNATTNICRDMLAELGGSFDPSSCLLTVKGFSIRGLNKSYFEGVPRRPLMLFNSRNYLEVAVNLGCAAKMLNLLIGDCVVFYLN